MGVETSEPVDIFDFVDYRRFLQAVLDERVRERGLSYRYFARKAGLSSPNYLQRVIKGERGLTDKTARAVGEALKLQTYELDYFLGLVRLDQTSPDQRRRVEEEVNQIKKQAESEARSDETIHSSWLHGVIWCLSACEGFIADVDSLHGQLRSLATPEEIQKSLDFLKRKGYIVPVSGGGPQAFTQKNIRFKVHNDQKRQLDLQRTYIRYLDMAKQRVVDDLAEREYQGLTIAIPAERFSEVKAQLRVFFQGLTESLAFLDKSDTVIRIQCAAFKITRPRNDPS